MASNPNHLTIVLLSTVVVMLAGIECVTVVGFDRTSRVQRKQVAQRELLRTVRDSATGGTAHIAVLGNSLALEGVDVPLLAANVETKAVPVPYFVLGTLYYDWYYGLKRLYAEGIRPRYVLLGLSPNHLASPSSRGTRRTGSRCGPPCTPRASGSRCSS